MTPLAADLLAARDYLDRHAWVRGANVVYSIGGRVDGCCLNGALLQTVSNIRYPLALRALYDVMPDDCADDAGHSVVRYNDYFAGSKQDVLDLIDRAIEAA